MENSIGSLLFSLGSQKGRLLLTQGVGIWCFSKLNPGGGQPKKEIDTNPGGGQGSCLSCFPRTAPVSGSTARQAIKIISDIDWETMSVDQLQLQCQWINCKTSHYDIDWETMLTRGSWYWNYIDQDYVTLQCCHLAGASLMFELILRWYWSGQLLTPGRGFLELTFLPSSLPISILLSFLTMAGVGWPNSRLCELVSTSPRNTTNIQICKYFWT